MKPSDRCSGHLFDRTSGYPSPTDLAADIAEYTGCDELLEVARILVDNQMSEQCWDSLAAVVAKHVPPPEPAPKLKVTATKEQAEHILDYNRILFKISGETTDTFVVPKEHADEFIRRLTDDRPPAKPGLRERLQKHGMEIVGISPCHFYE